MTGERGPAAVVQVAAAGAESETSTTSAKVIAMPVGEPEVVIDLPPQPVPPGDYYVRYVHHQTVVMFKGQHKVFMVFRIVSGALKDRLITRYYNVERVIGKPRKNGTFKPPMGGAFVHDYVRLFLKPTQRLDRISLDPFRNSILVARVSGVQRNSWGKEIPPQLWTTRISEFMEVYKRD